MSEKILPYEKNGDKKEEVGRMFNNIAGRYDLLNDLLSLGFGTRWRNRAVDSLLDGDFHPSSMLDVACGTGDFAIRLYEKLSGSVDITGIDISSGMLARARKKVGKRSITFIEADAESIPFGDSSFEALSCAYGIRNFAHPSVALSEFHRVLRCGGRVVIVELSDPKHRGLKNLFRFYFKYILPIFGGIVSGDASAYSYLPKSVAVFPHGEDFVTMIRNAGFSNCRYEELFGGIATVYFAEKL